MCRQSLIVVLLLFLSGCSSMKVVPLDQKTGRYPTSSKATVVASKPIDLDSRKGLILVPNGDFFVGEVTNMGYFTQVITIDELEKAIVQKNLSDKVPSIHDAIGISNAAKYYQPFLWLHGKTHGSGTQTFAQFILTDPLTLDDLLVVETHLDYVWSGVNDQNNWYPMFNALIDYIQSNSKTYHR
jgi:hypothetical protein